MSGLVLEMRPDQVLFINGATIRFAGKARIMLCDRARFLFGKQVMRTDEATTPARRVYLELQSAYAGQESDRAAALWRARDAAREWWSVNPASLSAPDPIERALNLVQAGEHYAALRVVRGVFEAEDLVAAAVPPERMGTNDAIAEIARRVGAGR